MEGFEVRSKESVVAADKEELILVFNLCSQWFGIDALKVKEIIKIPAITKLPNQPESVRGLIKLRDKVIPLIDTRFQMNMETMQSEKNNLIDMLKQREEEHVNYIQELTRCMENDTEFTLTTDPNSCKFGRWYNNFKTDNLVLQDMLEKFELPHNEIHETATRILKLRKDGKKQEALDMLYREKDIRLKMMIDLFEELYHKIDSINREFAILYERFNDTVAFSVDKVHQIMRIHNSDIKPLPNYSESKFAKGVFQTDVGMCIILNDIFLTEGVGNLQELVDYAE